MATKQNTLKKWFNEFASYMTGLEEGMDVESLEQYLTENPPPDVDGLGLDGTDTVMDFYTRMQEDPEFAAQIFDKKNQAKFMKAMELAADVITTGVEIGDAKEQIRQADAEARKLVKPTKPGLGPKNEKLKAAMRMAEQDLAGEGDRAFLSPHERAIQDQYSKDMGVAQTASGGQAGAYGAMAQQAATRRLNESRNLIPALAGKRQQDFQNYTNLAGMDIAEDQFRKRQQLSQYGQDLKQYNTDRNLISQTGSFGRVNLAGARRNMFSAIPDMIGEPLYNSLPMKAKSFLSPAMNRFQKKLSRK